MPTPPDNEKPENILTKLLDARKMQQTTKEDAEKHEIARRRWWRARSAAYQGSAECDGKYLLRRFYNGVFIDKNTKVATTPLPLKEVTPEMMDLNPCFNLEGKAEKRCVATLWGNYQTCKQKQSARADEADKEFPEYLKYESVRGW